MALNGSSSGAFDIMSLADGYVNYFISQTANEYDTMTEMATVLPIVMMIRLESKDLPKRTVTMTVHGDWVRESYKTVKATFTVTPKEHSNVYIDRLTWTVEFEKIRHDIGDPEKIIHYLVRYFTKIDQKFLVRCVLTEKVDFIGVKSPTGACFTKFIEALKKEATMEIEDKDLENRTSTIRMKTNHVLMRNYKTLKVTITITPVDYGNHVAFLTIPGNNTPVNYPKHSRVAWTIESEKISSDPNLATNTVLYFHEMIQAIYV